MKRMFKTFKRTGFLTNITNSNIQYTTETLDGGTGT